MVPPDKGYPIGIADFEEEQKEECLDRVEPAVDKVACIAQSASGVTEAESWLAGRGTGLTHKDVICLGAMTTYTKQLHQIEELAVDITTYLLISAIHSSLAARWLTVTGLSTYCTFASSMSSSFALEQTSFTTDSGTSSHRFSCSICLDNQLNHDVFRINELTCLGQTT